MSEWTIKNGAFDRAFDRIREDFPIFNRQSRPLHYLDSAASSQKPHCVIAAINDCYHNHYAPVHRGLYPLAEQASEHYEAARHTIARFIHASSANNVIFTRSATESINLVATGWARQHLQPGDDIVLSQMEHHSNFLPWQRVCQECDANLRMIPLTRHGSLDLTKIESILSPKTKLLALTQASNVLGVINPLSDIIAIANQYSIPVLVDATQSVGHIPVDVQALNCDFLVTSAHKMCGPNGIGILYAKTERLVETEPLLLGGGMVDEVTIKKSTWADIPARFEAGSPNLEGALGFAAAVKYLDNIGIEKIAIQVQQLLEIARHALENIDGVSIYGLANNTCELVGILSFNVDDIHPHDMAHIAGEHNVAIRAGHHCCQPLMEHLGVSSTVRASFNFYNNTADISALCHAIIAAKNTFKA